MEDVLMDENFVVLPGKVKVLFTVLILFFVIQQLTYPKMQIYWCMNLHFQKKMKKWLTKNYIRQQ